MLLELLFTLRGELTFCNGMKWTTCVTSHVALLAVLSLLVLSLLTSNVSHAAEQWDNAGSNEGEVVALMTSSSQSRGRGQMIPDVSYFACSRRHSQLSCILGCLRCVETYSRRVYKMASCCRECHVTQAVLVDSGPDLCSIRFVDFDYLKSLAGDWHDFAYFT